MSIKPYNSPQAQGLLGIESGIAVKVFVVGWGLTRWLCFYVVFIWGRSHSNSECLVQSAVASEWWTPSHSWLCWSPRSEDTCWGPSTVSCTCQPQPGCSCPHFPTSTCLSPTYPQAAVAAPTSPPTTTTTFVWPTASEGTTFSSSTTTKETWPTYCHTWWSLQENQSHP